MSLTREKVIETAFGILRDYGLADLSMRRLARDLGVQPGALYWHVKNKQDLLGILSVMILAPAGESITVADASVSTEPTAELSILRLWAQNIRDVLLQVRDGAEMVAFTHALAPDSLPSLLEPSGRFVLAGLPADQAQRAALTLVHYILGTVTQEQTRSGLVKAGVLPGPLNPESESATFNFGLDLFLAGVTKMVR